MKGDNIMWLTELLEGFDIADPVTCLLPIAALAITALWILGVL